MPADIPAQRRCYERWNCERALRSAVTLQWKVSHQIAWLKCEDRFPNFSSSHACNKLHVVLEWPAHHGPDTKQSVWLLESACHFFAWEYTALLARVLIIITSILSALCNSEIIVGCKKTGYLIAKCSLYAKQNLHREHQLQLLLLLKFFTWLLISSHYRRQRFQSNQSGNPEHSSY